MALSCCLSCEVGVDGELRELCHRNGGADPWHAHVIARLNANYEDLEILYMNSSFIWRTLLVR